MFIALILRLLLIENFNTSHRFYISAAAGIVFALLALAVLLKAGRNMMPAVLLLIAISAGFFAGFSFSRFSPAWSGLSFTKVTAFQASALSDSRKLSSGSYLLEAELSRVSALNGASADAGGKILLFFNSDPKIYQGRILYISAGINASEQHTALISSQHLGGVSMLKEPVHFTAAPSVDSIRRIGWVRHAEELRACAVSAIYARCTEMGPAAGSLFAALFTGCRDGLTAEETKTFRRAGCSHILALSGMHLGILSGIILLLLKPLPGRKTAFIISCIIFLCYLYLTGFGVSLVRAALMYFLCGAAMVFYRNFKAIDVLLLTFIITVLIDPSTFYTAAFRLSFLAVGGILLLSPILNRMLKPYLPKFLSLALAASIAAQLFVTPQLAALFGELFPAGLIAGIILAPMVTVFIWIGILFLITGWGFAAAAADGLYRLIFFTAGSAAALPSITVGDSRTAAVTAGCAAILVSLILYSLYRRKIDGISG